MLTSVFAPAAAQQARADAGHRGKVGSALIRTLFRSAGHLLGTKHLVRGRMVEGGTVRLS